MDSYGSNLATVLCSKESACCLHSVLPSVCDSTYSVVQSLAKCDPWTPLGVLETLSGCLRNSFRLSVASFNEKRLECLNVIQTVCV